MMFSRWLISLSLSSDKLCSSLIYLFAIFRFLFRFYSVRSFSLLRFSSSFILVSRVAIYFWNFS